MPFLLDSCLLLNFMIILLDIVPISVSFKICTFFKLLTGNMNIYGK